MGLLGVAAFHEGRPVTARSRDELIGLTVLSHAVTKALHETLPAEIKAKFPSKPLDDLFAKHGLTQKAVQKALAAALGEKAPPETKERALGLVQQAFLVVVDKKAPAGSEVRILTQVAALRA